MQPEKNADAFAKLKSYGDLVEQHYADRINAAIPSYAKIWAEYVGNDGTAHALPMPNADEQTVTSRDKYAERAYTLLESLALCWTIKDQLRNIEAVDNPEIYLQNLNLWMAYHAHIGRIYDMVQYIADDLKRPRLLTPFKEYWEERNIVLHSHKVPLMFVENVLAVPALGEKPGHWHRKMLWHELKSTDFGFLAQEVSDTLREIEAKLERFFAELRKLLPACKEWKLVNWSMVAAKGRQDASEQIRSNVSVSIMPSASGTQTNPPSGSV